MLEFLGQVCYPWEPTKVRPKLHGSVPRVRFATLGFAVERFQRSKKTPGSVLRPRRRLSTTSRKFGISLNLHSIPPGSNPNLIRSPFLWGAVLSGSREPGSEYRPRPRSGARATGSVVNPSLALRASENRSPITEERYVGRSDDSPLIRPMRVDHAAERSEPTLNGFSGRAFP